MSQTVLGHHVRMVHIPIACPCVLEIQNVQDSPETSSMVCVGPLYFIVRDITNHPVQSFDILLMNNNAIEPPALGVQVLMAQNFLNSNLLE